MSLISIQQQFQNQGIQLKSEWLEAQYNINKLYQSIYNAFLNSDLKDSCLPLSSDFTMSWGNNELGAIPNGRIFESGVILQIIDIINISKSLSHQIDTINGLEFDAEMERDNQNLDKDKDKAFNKGIPTSRTLKLLLSDGNINLLAMEFKTLKDISTALPLGAKVKLKDVMVLRGALMLSPNNFILLGGQIQQLNIKSLKDRLEEKLKMVKLARNCTNSVQVNGNHNQNSNSNTNNTQLHNQNTNMVTNNNQNVRANTRAKRNAPTPNLSTTSVINQAISINSSNSIIEIDDLDDSTIDFEFLKQFDHVKSPNKNDEKVEHKRKVIKQGIKDNSNSSNTIENIIKVNKLNEEWILSSDDDVFIPQTINIEKSRPKKQSDVIQLDPSVIILDEDSLDEIDWQKLNELDRK